jgi:diguanylate cyclase (GGDEF)-like protein
MLSPLHIFLIAALLCITMLFVLTSLFRSNVPGIREWWVANILGFMAFVLYAFGKELPPLVSYEVANGVYAAATAAILAGFRRFFGKGVPIRLLAAGTTAAVLGIGIFHYVVDSFALRTITVSIFQSVVCLAIGVTVYKSRKNRPSRYPYLLTATMALVVATGHAVRGAIYLANPVELTSLLQPSPWNLFFVSLGTLVLPVLTLGAVMMVHDTIVARAEHAANRDFLTGAWSRRAFFEIAGRELARGSRTGRRLSLLLLDVDHFKSINDTFGHAAGDQVLVDVVLNTRTAIRNIDYFARIGGEEFAALLPDTDQAPALTVAERLRETMGRPASAGDGTANAALPGYTVSIGLATQRDTESIEDLMRRADAALYRAKASGRNCVFSEPAVSAIA